MSLAEDETCTGCSTQCLPCKNKPLHHREMETKHYQPELKGKVRISTLIQILDECVLMPEVREELIESVRDV